MRPEIESYFLNPPAGSAASRAAEFGIDLTLTLEHLRLTPEERIRKLESFIQGVAELKDSVRITLTELEAIQKAQALMRKAERQND